ncbi:hypothetical protein C8R43DRAFT_868214, partial [Mycena crocata]
MHALIWIINALSPQKIRNRLMNPRSRFRKRLIAYLEDAHRAEFFHGTKEAVVEKRKAPVLPADGDSDDEIDLATGYQPPTQTFPTRPPPICTSRTCTALCKDCKKYKDWCDTYELETDDLLVRSNIH